jgi:hypothetical protein
MRKQHPVIRPSASLQIVTLVAKVICLAMAAFLVLVEVPGLFAIVRGDYRQGLEWTLAWSCAPLVAFRLWLVMPRHLLRQLAGEGSREMNATAEAAA